RRSSEPTRSLVRFSSSRISRRMPIDRKIFGSYGGVNISRFSRTLGEVPRRNTFVIGSCGQLKRYKGMHLLLGACAALRREGVSVNCWIVGEGPEPPNLERQIQALGVPPNDVAARVDALRRLATQPDEGIRLGRAARR